MSPLYNKEGSQERVLRSGDARYNFFRTSFQSFATLAFRGASPLAGSGTITASRRRRRNASTNALERPIPVLIVFQPAACSSSIVAPNASTPGGIANAKPGGNL